MRFPDPEELARFPLVPDFQVGLTEPDDGGRHIEFASATRGRLAGFPAWDHADRDLRHFIATDVPLGTIDEPYEDADEGWRISIFQDGEFVYVLEGDSQHGSEYRAYFRVKLEQYLAAWAFVVDSFNPILPLDDA